MVYHIIILIYNTNRVYDIIEYIYVLYSYIYIYIYIYIRIYIFDCL